MFENLCGDIVYRINAKALITTLFASDIICERIHDYSNRQWSGLISDFYKKDGRFFLKSVNKKLQIQPLKKLTDLNGNGIG